MGMGIRWGSQCSCSKLYLKPRLHIPERSLRSSIFFPSRVPGTTTCKKFHGLNPAAVSQGDRVRRASVEDRAVKRSVRQRQRAETCQGKGTLVGAVALITGTSIGVGILAVPAKTIAAGFFPSSSVMAGSWIFLVLEAFLLVEVNLALMSREKGKASLSKVISLQTMAEITLGNRGGILVGAAYVLLTYALIVAYISKSGEVLSLLFHFSRPVAEVLFTGLFGYFLLSGGTKLADRANQFMTAGLIGLFLLLVIGGSGYGDWAALLHQNWEMAPESIPVIFLALVYHGLIPVICTYLDGDVRRIQTAVVIGSAIPLAMLLCWNAVALSLASTFGNADPLSLAIQTSFTVQLFSLVAVLTSIIGSTLGMSEFFIERLGKSTAVVSPNANLFDSTSPGLEHIKLVSMALVLVPPLLLSLSISDAFFTAADLAGGYGMTTLYGVLPPVMAWGLAKESAASGNSQYPGGRSWITKRGTLAVTGVCACGIIAGQLILDLS